MARPKKEKPSQPTLNEQVIDLLVRVIHAQAHAIEAFGQLPLTTAYKNALTTPADKAAPSAAETEAES